MPEERVAPLTQLATDELGQGEQFLAKPSEAQRRAANIQRIALITAILAGLVFVMYGLIFILGDTWQAAGPAVFTFVGGGVYLMGRRLARQGYPDRAAYWMIGVVVILLPAHELFLWGATPIIAAGTLILATALGGLMLPRRQIVWAVVCGALGAGLTIMINQVVAWPRIDVAQLIFLRVAIPAAPSLLILIILWQIVRAFRIGTIRLRLFMSFVVMVLLPAIIISVTTITESIRSGQQQVVDQLESVVTLKETEVNAWVHSLEITLETLSQGRDVVENAKVLLQGPLAASDSQEAYNWLLEKFKTSIQQPRLFEEVFLMDIQGRVVLSTYESQEGKNYGNQPFLQKGLQRLYVQPPFYSPSLDRLSVIVARPLVDRQGQVVGVLAGRASMAVLNGMMRERIGLGDTGETYLVGADRAVLTPLRTGETGIHVYTQGAHAAIDNRANGSDLYEGYGGELVVGVYHWLPDLQVALLGERQQAEVYRGTYRVLGVNAGIALATVLLAAVASLFVTRSIANPLADLAETATQIAAGDLELVAKVEREDEIGTLAQVFNNMTGRLRDLISSLEERVADRTRDLEHRAVQLQAAAEVGRAAAALRDLDELLLQVTHLISERFGFYHVGVFLLDEAGEYAVLRAANSEGGQQMLDQGHRLKVGEEGIVGHVTGTREPRIALNVGQDAVHFQNPFLPNTRSEMALPLIAGGRLLGGLDVQSTEEAAFAQENIAVLQVLADQVAVAIENARLFAESQAALEAERRAYGEISQEAWTQMVRARPGLGFRSHERGVTRAGNIWRPEMEQAFKRGQTVQGEVSSHLDAVQGQSGGDGADTEAKLPLAVPIKVRGQVVGVLDTYKPDDAGVWTPDEVAFLEEVTERLGRALESARLFEESVEERDRTALLLEVSQRLGADLDFDAVVDTVLSFAPRLGAEAAELYITDLERETYFFKSSLPERANLTGDEARDFSALILGEGLEGWVLRERQPALVTDTRHDDRWLVLPGEEEGGPIRSTISMPLLTGRGRIQGVLSLTHPQPDAFDHDDLTLAMSLATQTAVAFENTSLFQATQAALEETESLYQASRAVAAADSMEDIVRAMVVNLSSPQVDQCFLGILDSSAEAGSDELMVVAAWSRDADDSLYPVGAQLSLAQDLIGEPQTIQGTMDRNQPLIVSDVASESWLTEAKRAELLAAGVRSWAVIPLVAVSGRIGILTVTATRPRAITSRNLQPYLTLASQVALSIERSNLFKQTQEALEETSLLYRASRAIGAASSIPEVADVLLGSVAESDFDRGLVLVRRQADDKLEVVAGWDRDGRSIEIDTLMDVSQVSPALTIYSGSARDKDLPNRSALNKAWRPWVTRGEGTALASVPILFRSRLLGILLIESQRARQLTEDVLQPFVTLAAQAAIAIENRRLFEETRRAAEEEALLNEMLREMATALDIRSIIYAVQASLVQLVPFDRMSVALVNEEMSALEVFHVGGDQPAAELDDLTEGQVLPLQESLIGQAINLKKTIVFDLTDSSLHGLEVEPLRQASIESVVIIPMIYGREVSGSLNLGHSHRETYATVNVPLLERVAQLIAVAMENARLFSQLSRRAVQLQTAAEVSQAATSTLDLNQLLPQAVELIRERFDLYYVGVFLVDETGEWAVLRAGTGEAGRIQLEQGHQLKAGGESMIGQCVANAQAHIVLDVGEEAVRFKNPALPDTQSEMALALVSGGQTIGAITVQSTSSAAFSREDITTLQTMADQLSNAIQNARFFEQTQAALAETEALYQASAGLTTAQSYDDILAALRQHTMLGQRAQNASLNLFDHPWTSSQTPEWVNVLARWGQPSAEAVSSRFPLSTFPSATQLLRSDAPTLIEDVASDPRLDDDARAFYLELFGAESAVSVPLVVGGQWIGYVNATYQQPTGFPESEARRLMAISGQAAVAVQNLRQLQQIQARARREAVIREITGKIRSSIDLDTILQTTVTEVARALGTSHGAIRLGSVESLKADGDQKPSLLSASSPDGGLEETGRESRRPVASDGDDADASPQQPQQVQGSEPDVTGKGDKE